MNRRFHLIIKRETVWQILSTKISTQLCGICKDSIYRRLIQYLWLAMTVALVGAGCKEQTRPSVLLILVDQMRVSDQRCSMDSGENKEQKSGFDLLCSEFVRFTHAYTPSTLEVPTLASVLTGLRPDQHRLRNNSEDLSRNFYLVPEKAVQKNYHTVFISGGLPVLRKTGLHQGFEIFDDLLGPLGNTLSYRPLRTLVTKAISSIEKIDDSLPFFIMMTVKELRFPSQLPSSDPATYRERSLSGSLDEVSDGIGDLFQKLKQSQQWNKTLIVVAGIRGRNDNYNEEKLEHLNLHSDNTQVAFFVKPPSTSQNPLSSWKIDTNVSLIDLAPTLEDYMGLGHEVLEPTVLSPHPLSKNSQTAEETHRDFAVSLRPLLESRESRKNLGERLISIESSWAAWHFQTSPRVAVISNENLFIHDASPLLFNTHMDPFETNPVIYESDWQTTNVLRKEAAAISSVPFSFRALENAYPERFRTDPELWTNSNMEIKLSEKLRQIFKAEGKNPGDQLPSMENEKQWLIKFFMDQKRWNELYEMNLSPFANFVALRNLESALNKNVSKNKTKLADHGAAFSSLTKDPCLRMIKQLTDGNRLVLPPANVPGQLTLGPNISGSGEPEHLPTQDLKICPDEKVQLTLQFLFADQLSLARENLRKRLEILLRDALIYRRYSQVNESLQKEWDLGLPRATIFEPFEMLLYLPGQQRYRVQLYNSLITRSEGAEM